MPEKKNHYYLWVEITLKENALPKFEECTLKLVAAVASQGWRLLAACSAITGVPNTIYHLWEIKDGNSLLDVMVKFSDSPDYQELLNCCERQVQQLMTAMPYNPGGANPHPGEERPVQSSRSPGAVEEKPVRATRSAGKPRGEKPIKGRR